MDLCSVRIFKLLYSWGVSKVAYVAFLYLPMAAYVKDRELVLAFKGYEFNKVDEVEYVSTPDFFAYVVRTDREKRRKVAAVVPALVARGGEVVNVKERLAALGIEKVWVGFTKNARVYAVAELLARPLLKWLQQDEAPRRPFSPGICLHA